MAYRTNPFLERMSERTTSDQEFVRLFSPRVLDKLEEAAFVGGVHVFTSSPGAGKTTLLRAFTPTSLRGFSRAQTSSEITETFKRLEDLGIVDAEQGPQMLGVLLSCASGYADLPPGSNAEEGLFRALLDCRIVLRAIRSLLSLVSRPSPEALNAIEIDYAGVSADLKHIPRLRSAAELMTWAEDQEKRVYAKLDALAMDDAAELPAHVRFEGVLWLLSVRFLLAGQEVAPKRLLMIDDVWKLRRKQRSLLIDELTVLRPTMPVWLAMRTSAMSESMLSPGVREGRDLHVYALEDMWNSKSSFMTFAQNVLDRRMNLQDEVLGASFEQCLRDHLEPGEIRPIVAGAIEAFRRATRQQQGNERYRQVLEHTLSKSAEASIDALLDLYTARILLARDVMKRQMDLGLALSPEEMEERDSSQVRAAAEIFLREELQVPYYFGLDKLCVMASSNIEELLGLAGALFVGIRAKQTLRKAENLLSPGEQERALVDAARSKLDFVPKSHTEGTRAKRLLESIGTFCREKTFAPNAPYAPGVTGVRLSQSQREVLESGQLSEPGSRLLRVLDECVADNLLLMRPSGASTAREPGIIFYLNRALCASFGLPLQMGGWQDVAAADLIQWAARGRATAPIRLALDA